MQPARSSRRGAWSTCAAWPPACVGCPDPDGSRFSISRPPADASLAIAIVRSHGPYVRRPTGSAVRRDPHRRSSRRRPGDLKRLAACRPGTGVRHRRGVRPVSLAVRRRCSDASSARDSAPPAELEASGPPRFAQAVGLLFAVVALAGYAARRRSARHGRRRGRPRGRVSQRSLRLLPRLRDVPADPPHHSHPQGSTRMSREALSSWTPTGSRPISTTRPSCSSRSTRTSPPTTTATSEAPSASTGATTCRTRSAVTSSTRPASRRCCQRAASATTTPCPVRRQQQLVRGLRLLVLQALRPRATSSCSTAAARSGSSTAASCHRRARVAPPRRTYTSKQSTPRSGPSATR